MISRPTPTDKPIKLTDHRIGNVYPAIETVAANIDALVHLSESVAALVGTLELRSNSGLEVIEYRYITTEEEDPESKWQTLVSYSDLSNTRYDFLEDMYVLLRDKTVRLEKELDELKALVNTLV